MLYGGRDRTKMLLCKPEINDYACLMRLILTRHHRTVSNAQDRILGWGDSPPDTGWESDVGFISERLRENTVRLDAIYSSDLQRAQRTAESYAASFGIEGVNAVPQLKEINYGKLQTQEKSWVYENYPQHKKDPTLVYPEGESFQQMQQRSVRFLSSLLLANPQTTVLIVSHAGVIRGIVSHFLGLDYASSLKHQIPFRYIGDFLFDGGECARYNELGDDSGFVVDSAISLPFVAA